MNKYYIESTKNRAVIDTIKGRKANWIGHILHRNCLLKHVIEGKLEGRIETTGRWGKSHKHLLNDLTEKTRYWKLKEEALDCTLWRTCFGRGYGPVVRQTTGWMNTVFQHPWLGNRHPAVQACTSVTTRITNFNTGRMERLMFVWYLLRKFVKFCHKFDCNNFNIVS
jgi:hypothetical protein